jgi:hypothetical protein
VKEVAEKWQMRFLGVEQLTPAARVREHAVKAGKSLLQGLKPVRPRRNAPWLKPRPPKEKSRERFDGADGL